MDEAVSIVARLLDDHCICACPACGAEFDYCHEPESGMGWVACPTCREPVTQAQFQT